MPNEHNGGTLDVHLPSWGKQFAKPARHKCAYGGRGSGKTWTIAHLLIARAAKEQLRVVCCRELASSIQSSSKLALEVAISRLGLSHFFKSYAYTIRGANGSLFRFTGVERTIDSIRGWEDVDVVWFEEAQNMSDATARVLYPTIRKPGSEVWVSWNPINRSDYVWRRFILNPRDGDIICKINWHDNPWFPKEADDERRADKKDNPEMYAHIWEGEPDDEGAERKVLPFAMLNDCLDAFEKHGKNLGGLIDIGLDVADAGDNWNALVVRQGPTIVSAEKFRSKIIADTARRADHLARSLNATRVYYDSQGVGAGVRSYFADNMKREYATRPEMFGGKVKGEKTIFSYKMTNADFFARRNAQLGWALRLRAVNTRKLLAGEKIDPAACLFIDPSIHRIDEFLAQLSQPCWKEGLTGKTELVKRDEDEESPDLYDACVLSFAKDSQYGLRAR